MRVTITDLDHDSWAIEQGVAEAEGVEFQIIHGGKDAGLDPRVKGSNGLLVQYADITAEVMDYLLPELKVIGRYGVGVDTIDLDAAEQRGIVVVNVPDYGTQSVADHAITLALAVARNLSTLDALARKSTMDLATAMPIHQFVDQTFGVLGFGAIGHTCANKARGLGFQTQVCDVMIPQGTTEVDGFPVVSQDELLATSDIISVHVPLIPATKHLFNDETFTGRTYIWQFAVDVIGRSPLIGQGYASFWGAGQGSIVEREAPGFIVDLLQAHNGYLDTLLETGAVGFSILIALILAALFVAARSAVRRPAIAWLSMTLVLTKTSYSWSAKARITSSFSPPLMRPCSSAMRRSARDSFCRRS